MPFPQNFLDERLVRPSVNVSSDLGGSSVEPLQVLSDHRSL